MNLKAWLAAHSITSQSIASLWIGLTLLYDNDSNFHDYLQHAYASIPHGLHSFIVGIVIPLAIFWRSTHTTKVTAEIEDGSPAVVNASASVTTKE